MRLITHNMVLCNVKGCTQNNFPLKIKATSVAKKETDFNPEFVAHMIPKLDWSALVKACKDLEIPIPEELPADAKDNTDFLKSLHTVLLDTHIQEGSLVCNNCNRVYPIQNGIPNMLLTEDEV